ncbi:MAG: PilN domain-containing protein [Burkholderiales bacterium]
MILINLLPHREEKRRRRRQAFFVGLGLAAAVGLVIASLWYLVLMEMISGQQSRNEFLQAEIQRLETQIKDIASLKAEIESLKARQKVVEDFQIDRNMPVHLLNELVRQTPEGVYLTTMKQDGQNVTVGGLAQTNERVSEFLRNTAYNSPWLEKPVLVEIKSTTLGANTRDSKRLFDFSIKLTLKRPQDKQAGQGPDGAAPAAGAASAARAKAS